MEENFSGRVKDIETKLKEGTKLEKKPKDLLRAIGLYFFFNFGIFFSMVRNIEGIFLFEPLSASILCVKNFPITNE